MQIVDVKVNDVEFVALDQFDDLVEHHKMMGDLIDAPFVESQRSGTARNEPRACDGVTAGKQRDVMTLVNQLLGEVRHDALGAAVQLRRNAFIERRYLCDSERGDCP